MSSFYDTFQRADNPASLGNATSGPAWTTLAGTFGILGGQAYNPSGVLSQATVDLGMSDCVVRWQIPTEGLGTAVLVRCTNVNNLFYIRVNGGAYTLSKIVAGVFTQLISGGDSSDGDQLLVRCEGSNITLYVNGIFAFTYSDSFNQTETHFGIRCQDVNTRFSSMAAQALSAAGATWHVTTAGSYFGDGTATVPWDIRTALTSMNGAVLPGDTIFVHGGNYLTSGDPRIQITLGSASGPAINVKRYPGEIWPRLYVGVMFSDGICPGYVNIWGLQFIQNNPQRINNYRGDNPTYDTGGNLLEAPFCELHYCIIANAATTGSGYFFGQQAYGSTVHMNLLYYLGFRDVFNGLPAGQGFYRQCDDLGTGIFQTIDTCIGALQYQSGMQIQGGAAANFNHGKTLKSLFFYGGYLGSSYAGGQAVREILLGSSSASPTLHADQMYFDNVWCWTPDGAGHEQAVQLGYNNPDNTFVSWTNSVIKGYLTLKLFRTVEFYGNFQACPTYNKKVSEVLWTPVIGAEPTPTGLGYDHNQYFQTNDGTAGVGHFPFLTNDSFLNHEYKTIPLWNAGTGYDPNSTLDTYVNAPQKIGIYRNTYEPNEVFPTPRAFVYVFSFAGQTGVTLDFSSCLDVGDSWELYDWGQYELDNPVPVQQGTWTGSPVSFTMQTQYLPTLIADPTGARSQHDPLPVILPGQPSAYILFRVLKSVPDVVPSGKRGLGWAQ